jgi:hypothetical protein
MSRIISLFAPVLSTLFVAVIVVIQAQPYEGDRLRALLASRGSCPMPCFLGIRAGMTPGDEALAILQNHAWVDRKSIFMITDEARQYSRVTWHWSGQQPDFLTGSAYMTYPHPHPNGRGAAQFGDAARRGAQSFSTYRGLSRQ